MLSRVFSTRMNHITLCAINSELGDDRQGVGIARIENWFQGRDEGFCIARDICRNLQNKAINTSTWVMDAYNLKW